VSAAVFLHAQTPTKNEPLCVATTGQWAPFNLIEEGDITGIGIEYWKMVAQHMGVSYRVEIKTRWQDVLESIKRRTCDLTIATEGTPERESYAIASKPYASYPIVIVTRLDVGFIDDLNQISDETIALPKHYATTEKILRRYKNLKHVVQTENIDEALRLVEEGKAFATVGVLPVVAYKITKGSNDLKISGKTSERFNIGFLVRSDRPELVEKIDRAIDAIPQSERKKFYERWIRYPRHKKSWIEYFAIAGVIFALGSVLLGWYAFRLKRDVKDKTRNERRLKKIASTDVLTRANTRRHTLEYFKKLLREARAGDTTFSIVFFDVDFLKIVNDTYGHDAGDRLLKEVVRTVKEHIRPGDVVGRWGGDEFMIVLPHMHEKEAEKFVERLYRALSRIRIRDDFTVSCSFGYASYRPGDTKASMFKRADTMLYEMKRRHHREKSNETRRKENG
jgi:polar amino acid transport system substrate-binding protein